MLCDVSVYMGEARLAEVYCEDCGMKVTTQPLITNPPSQYQPTLSKLTHPLKVNPPSQS